MTRHFNLKSSSRPGAGGPRRRAVTVAVTIFKVVKFLMADTVSVVAEGGDQFAKMFYSSLDTSRQDLKHLYHDESKVVWNGQPLLGREKVSAFLNELPPSRHELSSLDCQPVAVPGNIDDP